MHTDTIKEDVTAPGTGLGMSIVKQIVDLSGGRIDIKSDQNIGTTIKLSLPLANCPPPAIDLVLKADTLYQNEDQVESVRRRAGGRTVSILGFDDLSGRSKLQLEALASLKASMAKYSSEWFGLKLVPTGKAADIAIADESAYLNQSVSETQYGMLLILCSNSARRDIFPSRLHTGQIVEFVSKPCGPHRLAKALLNCLDTEDGTPHTPSEERVSAKRPHIEAVSPEKALVTAGTSSSSQLIGSLQSSMGFSPTVLNLLRTPSLKKLGSLTEPADPTPLLSRRIASTNASKTDTESAETSELLSLGIPPSTNFLQASSSSQIPGGSTSHLEDLKPRSPDVAPPPPPPRKPVMLLVEV